MATMIADQAASLQQAHAELDQEQQSAAFTTKIRGLLNKLPVKISYPLFQGLLGALPDEWPPQPAQLVLEYNARVLPALAGRQRQAWLLTVAEAQRGLGKAADAVRTIASAGLDKDLCVADDSAPALLEQHFSYEDYPDEFIAGEQQGTVLYEFNLTPTGSVTRPRAIYSLPSGLFDEPSAKGLSTIRYTAPVRHGKASACRGLYQPIVWRLEDDELTVPQLMPDIGPTT